MADPFIGEIRAFAFNFAPKNWAICAGQILSIQQNTALFSILGVQFGGNGTTNFGLPNLQGSAPMGTGVGPGLTPRTIGEVAGTESVTLLQNEMPVHSHTITAQASAADKLDPAGNYLAQGGRGTPPRTSRVPTYESGAPNAPLSTGALALSGGSQAHNNMQTCLALNFCICLIGTYPSRG